MAHNGHGRCWLSPAILLRIYRQLESNPLKIFNMSELGLSSWKQKTYMLTLERLGLVQQVPYIHNRVGRDGKTMIRVDRLTMGWRIKK